MKEVPDGQDRLKVPPSSTLPQTVVLTDGAEVGFVEIVRVGLADGLAEGVGVGLEDGLAEGIRVGFADGLAEGLGVGFSEQVPNCTSNPLGLLEEAPLLTVNVIVVVTPSPVAVKDDNPPKPFLLNEVIVVDDVPSETTTEVTVLSTEK